MRSGLVARAGAPGVLLCDETLAALKLKCGDFIRIVSVERGNEIVREIKACQTSSAVRPNYAYMDAQSLRFLEITLDEMLEVFPSSVSINCP